MSSIPLWIRCVLCFLAASAARDLGRVPMPAAVRARAEELRVEREPRRMCARELRTLPGLGQKLALAVAEARDAPHASRALAWEDVPGIGEIRAARIRAWCRARGIEPDPLAEPSGKASGYPLGVDRRLRTLVWIAAWLAACGDTAGTGVGERREPPPTRDTAGARETMQPMKSQDTPDTPPEQTRTRALLGGALHALESGPASGPLVLLLHGARFSARTWEELGTLELLARAGDHAVAIDWPGYGATPRWDSEPVAATLLTSVCDELGAEHLALVAPSMGGRFAFEFLAQAAGRVSALVAIAPAGVEDLVPGSGSTPTLLVWGEKDEVVPLECGRALAGRLKGARLEVLAGASHPCYLDQPERFHALLKEFLEAELAPHAAPGK